MQKAARVATAQATEEAATVAEQEMEKRREEERVIESVLVSSAAGASDEASPDAEDGEDEEDDTTVVPVVDLTGDAVAPFANDSDDMESFAKMCEDMALAIEAKNGPEEISQPWLGQGEDWMQRTPEVSDTEAN